MSNPNLEDLIPPEQPVAVAKVLDALPGIVGGLDSMLRDLCGQKMPFVLLVFAQGGAMHATNIVPASQAIEAVKQLAEQWDVELPQAQPRAH